MDNRTVAAVVSYVVHAQCRKVNALQVRIHVVVHCMGHGVCTAAVNTKCYSSASSSSIQSSLRPVSLIRLSVIVRLQDASSKALNTHSWLWRNSSRQVRCIALQAMQSLMPFLDLSFVYLLH